MCGRYASARKRQELLEEVRVERDRTAESLEPDYNVAPTKPVYAVLTRQESGGAGQPGGDQAGGKQAGGKQDGPADSGAPERAEPDAVRELRVVRWGLVPFW